MEALIQSPNRPSVGRYFWDIDFDWRGLDYGDYGTRVVMGGGDWVDLRRPSDLGY